jgi:hypothetical protein
MNKLYKIKTGWKIEYIVATSIPRALIKMDKRLRAVGVLRELRKVEAVELIGDVVL